MAELKNNRWTPMDTCTYPEHPMKIKRQSFRNASSRATWQNLSAPSSNKQTQLKHNDLHPSVSSEPLIEDEMPSPMATPNLVAIYAYSSMI